MAKEIVWTKRAYTRFNKIIAYLETEWGENPTEKFIKKTYHVIELISKQPEIGSVEDKEKNIRGFLLTKHNRLFYRITETEIILLNFFDTRSGPERKKF